MELFIFIVELFKKRKMYLTISFFKGQFAVANILPLKNITPNQQRIDKE